MHMITITVQDERFNGIEMTDADKKAAIMDMLLSGAYDFKDSYVKSLQIDIAPGQIRAAA
jgi:hypothetical protein